ncbi:MAG TPA: hypothetical protein DCZ75_15925 [Geobacter sp.]|nr:hypothetical protein [Geobacter sp.]
MCTLVMAYRAHPRYRLVLAANRDEFYQRPTAAAAYWDDAPQLFAGRDLVHGGSWLGVTREGRIAALTNYREPHLSDGHGSSRGRLVSNFLKAEEGAEAYLGRLREGVRYGGYNLLVGESDGLFYYSNKSDQIIAITPGIHGLSNHLLNTPWPKVRRAREGLARVLEAGEFSAEDVFAVLADTTRPPDEELPDTGVGIELERILSPVFIKSENYGTRCSSILLVEHDGKATFVERSFDGGMPRESSASFQWT